MRRSMTVVVGLCLLAATTAVAQEGLPFGPAGGAFDDELTGFFKCEVLSLGAVYPHIMSLQLLRATFTAWGFRIGTTLGEAYGPIYGGGQATWPVHVGYTLLSRPHRVLFFHNMFPEVYGEVSAAFWKKYETELPPFVRGSLYAGVEGFGLGAGLEVGVMSLGWDATFDPHVQGPIKRFTSPYVALRLKVLAVSIGF
jgi:hypothetical protein